MNIERAKGLFMTDKGKNSYGFEIKASPALAQAMETIIRIRNQFQDMEPPRLIYFPKV